MVGRNSGSVEEKHTGRGPLMGFQLGQVALDADPVHLGGALDGRPGGSALEDDPDLGDLENLGRTGPVAKLVVCRSTSTPSLEGLVLGLGGGLLILPSAKVPARVPSPFPICTASSEG